MRMLPASLLIASLSLLLASPAAADEESQAGWGRSCRTDLFTVDVPTNAPMHLPPTWALALPPEPDWFDPPCHEGVTVVEDVFAGSSVLPERHYRVHFECEHMVREVRREAVCAVIEALDTELQNWLGEDASAIYIGRECDGTAQSPPGTAWQLAALNQSVAPPESGQHARVAVIDTAFAGPEWPETMAHPHRPTAFSLPVRKTDHPLLVLQALREIAPVAPVDFYVGLRDAQGGPTTDIARAIGQLVDRHRETPEPLVVNLSLGWPPEMATTTLYAARPELAREMDGNRVVGEGEERTCVESPSGEAVRAGLQALVDMRGERDTVILAAAGNRSVARSQPDWVEDSANWEALGGRFAPSAWASRPARIISVGASAAGHIAGHAFERTRLPDLFAPGRSVPVPNVSGPGNGDPRMTVSGTSIATAYASGVAAALPDVGGSIFITTLYDRLLGEARCAPAVLSWPPVTSAAGTAGPSFLRLAAEPPLDCNMLISNVSAPEVCTLPGCTDRAFPHPVPTIWPDWFPAPVDNDNYAAGFAVPQPTPNGCPENDCFGVVDKASRVLKAWLDFKQMSAYFDKAVALDALSVAIIERGTFGKTTPLETIKVDVAQQLFGQKTITGQYTLQGVTFSPYAQQAIMGGKAEVQLQFHWRGQKTTWREDAVLPVRWD